MKIEYCKTFPNILRLHINTCAMGSHQVYNRISSISSLSRESALVCLRYVPAIRPDGESSFPQTSENGAPRSKNSSPILISRAGLPNYGDLNLSFHLTPPPRVRPALSVSRVSRLPEIRLALGYDKAHDYSEIKPHDYSIF